MKVETQAQRLMLGVYGAGAWEHLADGREFDEDALGDTLLTFLLRELEDGDCLKLAHARLHTAIADLQGVLDALEGT